MRRSERSSWPSSSSAPGQVRLQVRACGVCRTDLHILDGELAEPKLPLVLGHQIVGTVIELGPGVTRFELGQRVGVPWLGWTCGSCRYCVGGRENLCDDARFTGYTIDGGFAEEAGGRRALLLSDPAGYPDLQAAPLLCAGLIGYRALRLAGDAERLGLYGFGAAAHIVCQVARRQGRRSLRLHPARRRAEPGLRARARRRVGGRVARPAAGAARRRDHLRAGRATRARRAAPRSARAAPSSAPAST